MSYLEYCSNCGNKNERGHIDGNTRSHCVKCKAIHYENPKPTATLICPKGDSILLGRRAFDPGKGEWGLPGGFLELNETLEEAAIRETSEEACAEVELQGLYSVFSIPHVSQVFVIFRAHLVNGDFSPGPESLDTELFEQQDIPWGKIAFPVVVQTLERYFKDRVSGQYIPLTGTIPSRCKLA